MRVLKMSLATNLLLVTVIAAQTDIAYAQDWRKTAEGRPVDCLLQVKNRTYLDGTCVYKGERGGSFRLFGDKYFVYLNTFGNDTAGASWNGRTQASHAQESLGEGFKRNGGCWSNRTANICAWNKGDRPGDSNNHNSAASTPIKFPRGAYSTIVTAKLDGYDTEQNYTIAVGKGQSLDVKQIDRVNNHYVSVYLTDPQGGNANDLDASCHSRATVSPTMAGSYAIKVVECRKADPWKGSYSLKVTVR